MGMNRRMGIKRAGIIAGLLLLVYVGYVAWFEIQLGYRQPQGSTSIVIATFDDAERHERVVRLERIDGNSYIAANHWPRAWYRQARRDPAVEVRMPGQDAFAPYLAVPLEGPELERISGIYAFDFPFRLQTGFPPRRFLRLDPR